MPAYELLLSISSTFVYIMYSIFYTSLYTPDSIFYPSVSTLDSIPYLFDPTLTTFPLRSLVEVGPICRLSTCFQPMITSQNFANRAPCRAFVKKYASMCYVMQYAIDMLLLSNMYLENR